MTSSKPTDELLAALPDVGVDLWMLDHSAMGWRAKLYDPVQPSKTWEGWGETPAEALIEALKEAGVVVTDE